MTGLWFWDLEEIEEYDQYAIDIWLEWWRHAVRPTLADKITAVVDYLELRNGCTLH